MEATLLGRDTKGIKVEKDSNFHDFDSSFSYDSHEEDRDTSRTPRFVLLVGGKPPKLGSEAEIESDYTGSEELKFMFLKYEDE